MAKKVFIDPGHGGSDSGAIGVNNLYEKNITLQISKKVETLLKNQGIEVKLSRDSDKYLSLDERTSSANLWKADCFVAIHCNAFNESARGIETFSSSSTTNDLATLVHSQVLDTKAFTVTNSL